MVIVNVSIMHVKRTLPTLKIQSGVLFLGDKGVIYRYGWM
jgi:hypothetical protein